MADYATHAHRAQELLEQADKQAKRRYSENQLIAMAQVEALLALAAATAGTTSTAPPSAATDQKVP
ncbi:hypothetical protein [Streptomyces fungicidicus]|uniref:hypothetical protein n=1 Tax=Streptomyces fungicidicus TaxID=68203 RepID=UPI003323D917